MAVLNDWSTTLATVRSRPTTVERDERMKPSMSAPTFALSLLGLSLFGCATIPDTATAPAHDNLDAVTWLQTSAEYAAVTTGIYSAATAALEGIVSTGVSPERGRAVVLDVDETVLDNAAYQAQLVLDDETYSGDSWDAWIALEAADAVPGAVDFVRTAQARGFQVAFITNRSCRPRRGASGGCPQRGETLANLQSIGIPTEEVTLLLRGDRPSPRCRSLLSDAERVEGTWSSDKASRRACVSLDHDIVMLFGDQLGDFTTVSGGMSREAGRQVAAEYEEAWGKRWFMLPNPTYGEWKPTGTDGKRARIRGTD